MLTNIRICVVDDQLLAIDAIKLILAADDKIDIVGTFNSAETFIEQYDQLLPDVTIMDLDLPVLSGIDAIITVKQTFAAAKFLVLTNYEDDEKLFTALKAGAGGYLLKRKSLEELPAAIESICTGGAPMTPQIAKKVISFFQRQHMTKVGIYENLTEKETTVLGLLADGLLYKEIAGKLNLGIDAVKKITQHIYEKLQVRTRSEAIRKYLTS